jgi:membrane-associated phospholipid phosphatase
MQWLRFFNQALAHPLLDAIALTVTLGAMPALALWPLGLLARGRRREGWTALAALALSVGLSVALQVALGRPRPEEVRLILRLPAPPSFPSGHAAAAFAWAVLAGLQQRRRPWLRLGVAAAVALSRVYLGRHYPGDALGGAILGAGVAAVIYGLAGLPCRGASQVEARPWWAWWLWGQVMVVALVSLSAYLGLLSTRLPALPGLDKALHALLFGGLALPAVGWWGRARAAPVLAGLALLAAAEEALQALSPARAFDSLDLAASMAGLMLFGCLGRAMLLRRATRGQFSPRHPA